MHYTHLTLARQSQEVARKSSGTIKDFEHISTMNDNCGTRLQDSILTSTWKRWEVLELYFGQDLHSKIKLVFAASKDMNRLPVLYLEVAPVSFANQNMH